MTSGRRSTGNRARLAAGVVLAVLTLLPAVPLDADPAAAHPPPQVWVEVLEWEKTGTVDVWHPPETHIDPLVPPLPITETQDVWHDPETHTEPLVPPLPITETQDVWHDPETHTEPLVPPVPITETQEVCDFDPISGLEYNCRDEEVTIGWETTTEVTIPGYWEEEEVIIGWETTTEVTIPGYWEEEDVFGWVDNGYWAPGVHDDAAPEHDDPDDPDDPPDDPDDPPDDPDDPDAQCTIDAITLIADCTPAEPDEHQQQSLAEMTDEELAALGYMRCPGEVLVTTGVLCPGHVEYATEEPDGGCPDGSEWTEEFGGRCVTEAMELTKCDEEGENCNETPPIRTYCPAHSSLTSVSDGPVEIDGSEYTVCYFSCDHGDPDLAELIEDRVGYQTDCGPDDSQESVCPNGDPVPDEGCCPNGAPAATDGCCVDGTPAPPGGCAAATCPTGDPMPDEGCCPSGEPATADGCCVDGTPAPADGCAAVTCPNGDPMPDEGCCPSGEPATADGCGSEVTCPNGEPVPATGGCCVDGTPAPPGGCGIPTCPNGEPVPAGGCCSDGTAAPAGGCSTTQADPEPSIASLTACRDGDVVTVTWAVTRPSGAVEIEEIWVDWIQTDPVVFGGSFSVPGTETVAALNAPEADSGTWQVFVQLDLVGGITGDTDWIYVDASTAPCVPTCAMTPVELMALESRIVWQSGISLNDPPRNPYVAFGTSYPSPWGTDRRAMAGASMRVDPSAADRVYQQSGAGSCRWVLASVTISWDGGSAQELLDSGWNARVPDAPDDRAQQPVSLTWAMVTTWTADEDGATETITETGGGDYYGSTAWSTAFSGS